ncbi:MAG: dicarboxylate/amino acid:cation symporter [Gammaproteobacteria bacterium]|jgi:Na+/H+-dicarboxylate symporter|nr:dicarboxylate/amino acid:cation symporter [Gammaproteobacteria bacterium]
MAQTQKASFFSSIAKIPQWIKIFIGLMLGLAIGLLLGEKATLLQPIGNLFIQAIMMLIIPVVFVSVVSGIDSMKKPGSLGRIGLKTLLVYIITMFAAGLLAFLFASILQPGAGLGQINLAAVGKQFTIPQTQIDPANMLINIIPSNVFNAFTQGNILQVLFFAIILGLAINVSKNKVPYIAHFFAEAASLFHIIIRAVMSFAPLGVFAIAASITGTHSISAMLSLFYLVLVMLITCVLILLIVYGVGLRVFARLNPMPFFRKMLSVQLIALSTSSSAATLPVAIDVTENKLGVKKDIVGFVQTLGTTINMAGMTAYLVVVVVFAANLAGVELSTLTILKVTAIATIASMGAAGVPGSAVLFMALTLSVAGLPPDAIALVLAVERFMDMLATTLNVTGDSFTAVLVGKSENEFDENIYFDRQKAEV